MILRTLLVRLALTTLLTSASATVSLANPLMEDEFFSDKTTVEQVQAELDKGALLTDRDRYGSNPLHLAISGHAPIEVIRYLIEKGAPVNQPEGKKGNLATHYAAYTGNLETLQALKEGGANFLALDDLKETALHWLTYNEKADRAMLDFLLNEGIDPNAQSQTGTTPAQAMAWSGAETASQLLDALIAVGSEPAGINADGQDMFMMSVSYAGKGAYLERLFGMSEDPFAADNKGLSGVLLASQWGINKERLEFLEAKGFDIHARNPKGENAIIMHCQWGDADGLKLLLDRGFDVNSAANDGTTPLLNTLKGRASPAMVQALLDAGADVNRANAKGVTPLMRLLEAAAPDEPESEDGKATLALYDLLVSKGAGVLARDVGGATTLIYALRGGQPVERIKQILAAGVDVNAVDGDGNTALIYAALSAKDPAIVEILLDAGADKTVKDVFDDTVAIMAQDNASLKDSPVLERLL